MHTRTHYELGENVFLLPMFNGTKLFRLKILYFNGGIKWEEKKREDERASEKKPENRKDMDIGKHDDKKKDCI